VDTPSAPLVLPTRREFCSYACQAASLAAAGSLAACSSPTSPSGSSSAPKLTAISGSVSGRTVSVTVDAASGLTSVGSAVMVNSSRGTFLVSRTGDTTFSALTATCTHEGCIIDGFGSSQFVCPCHGSHFTTSGAVAQGPASRALQQFPTQFVDPVLSFDT
jgi:cytochrome b6-f complex iron-sulfur subunit